MRVFALSDVHVDYDVNLKWLQGLSQSDYRDDLLILAGDVSHRQALLARSLDVLTRRFRKVLFVPGNHDLWVLGEGPDKTSLQKFAEVVQTAEASGASMAPYEADGLLVMPLLGWYDYSFGEPSEALLDMWMDFRACRWPHGFEPADVAGHFDRMNGATGLAHADLMRRAAGTADVDRIDSAARTAVVDRIDPAAVTGVPTRVITFSHFLPRIDLIPIQVPRKHRVLDPVLGSTLLEDRLRGLNPAIHVYGHSHINRSTRIEGIRYVNNAFGYPQESRIASKQLLCIDEI